jgi:hypothetical protein
MLSSYQETQSKMTTGISNKPLNLERQYDTIVFGIAGDGVTNSNKQMLNILKA